MLEVILSLNEMPTTSSLSTCYLKLRKIKWTVKAQHISRPSGACFWPAPRLCCIQLVESRFISCLCGVFTCRWFCRMLSTMKKLQCQLDIIIWCLVIIWIGESLRLDVVKLDIRFYRCCVVCYFGVEVNQNSITKQNERRHSTRWPFYPRIPRTSSETTIFKLNHLVFFMDIFQVLDTLFRWQAYSLILW